MTRETGRSPDPTVEEEPTAEEPTPRDGAGVVGPSDPNSSDGVARWSPDASDTPIDDAHDGVQCLSGSPIRVAVLRTLRREPRRPAALTDAVDATRTTIQRILAGFRKRHWVIKRDGAYHVTRTGREVHDAYEALLSTVARADRYGEFVSAVERVAPGFPTEAVDEGTLTVADDRNPLAAVDRVAELMRSHAGTPIRSLSPIVTQRYNEAAGVALDEGSRIELIIDDRVATASVTDFEPETDRAIESDRASVHVAAGRIEHGLVRCEDLACLIVHDDNNNPRYVFESSDPAVLEWADERYETLLSDAVPLSTAIERL